MCDSQIMRQRKGATIIINGEPTEVVARREQRKGGMMGGWYGFRAQGIHNNGKSEKKKSWYITILLKKNGVVWYPTPEVTQV